MKLLATDYDGTLCYGYGDVMPEDLDAIRRWKEAGNLFAVVTGRSGLSIHRELDKYDLNPDFIICNNGGLYSTETDAVCRRTIWRPSRPLTWYMP